MTSTTSSSTTNGVPSETTASTSSTTSSTNTDEPPLQQVVVTAEHSEQAEAKSLQLKTLGNEQIAAGRFLEAIRYYSQALEYTPLNAILLSNRAQAYLKVENYGLAVQDATAAIDLEPDYVKGYYRRASAHLALQKYKLARKDFRKACKLRPKDRDARAKLAVCEKAIKEQAFCKAIMSEQTAPLSQTLDVNLISLDKASYPGPNPDMQQGPLDDMEQEAAFFIPGKLPLDFVMAAVETFRDQKLIHKRYVARLLIAAKHYFQQLPSLYKIQIPNEPPQHDTTATPRITVCGDTHGQYYDVLNIFKTNGYPSSNNPYLFNGDFVDRGSFSVEVILTLLLFKFHNVHSIYLTRGNHETKNMNRIYGFEGEVKAKYDDVIFELFLEVFSQLPLAATLQDKVFVTHGGLPTDPHVTLDDITKIPRGMEPPETGLMSDLLWSDPQPFEGKSPSKRGVGYSFGPDITQAFLERNQLTLLVRSHEVKEEGYLVEHGGKTITVFSAPNYCDTMGNKGAFIHFDATMEPKFTQYEAVPHPDVRPMAYAAGMGGLFA